MTPTILAKCNGLVLEIHRLDNIGNPRVQVISRDSDSLHSTVYEIQCVVPPNDTSGIEMVMRCGADSIRLATFWVDVNGKTLMYPGNPRLLPDALDPPKPPRIMPADSVNHIPPSEIVDSNRIDDRH
jgi:hypothetical protein